jgi:hypothetical protein
MAQKSEKLAGKRTATGCNYDDKFFENPWNAGIDSQYGDENGKPNESKTLYSPTSTVVGMHALEIHDKDSYDRNWEHGYRDGVKGKKGR